jgi:predicted porin
MVGVVIGVRPNNETRGSEEKMFKRAFAISAVSMPVLWIASPEIAQAEDAVVLYGQINRAVMFADNSSESKAFFVDGSTSGSRIGMKGKKKFGSNTAGFKFEVSAQSNASSSVNFASRSSSFSFGERHIDFYIKGGFGQVSLGQGNGAANGGMEVDQSGTTLFSYSGMTDFGGAISFVDSTGSPVAVLDDTFNNIDFESHHDRLRYDSPSLGSVKLAASVGTKSGNDIMELAVRSGMKLGNSSIKAALGYSLEDKGPGDDETTFGGSLSWAQKLGFNATLAYGVRERDGRDDKTLVYLKAGYKTGPHAFSVDYGIASDFDATGDESTAIGLAYRYKAAKWLEFYGGAHIHSLDRTGVSVDDITVIAAGTRIKF